MIDTLRGQRCTSIRRFHHRFAGRLPANAGPVEFLWEDGTYLSLDANSDWTMSLSAAPWVDPFEAVPKDRRQALAEEVGLWEEALSAGDLRKLIGRPLISADAELNEVGELTGLRLAFKGWVAAARVLNGELMIEVLEQ